MICDVRRFTSGRSSRFVRFSSDGARGVSSRCSSSRRPAIEVREHQFLAATGNLHYAFTQQKGAANMLFGGSGRLVFTGFTGPGRVGIQPMSVHLPSAEEHEQQASFPFNFGNYRGAGSAAGAAGDQALSYASRGD